ncbi:expressed unknown protein [Seminavis robusta]|uniref:NADH:ubiquinone oxidoreductase intermediate-associated protein 30 domain-containing protein n=1 Tax=Seminavis robusta TaxID=568900 RepID=A0A9N8ES57_9STRA|nr:expressed unknown protein [Seminavis robusta]|eukprot:Sro1724_g293680.1 n/a (288) ;mRNA; f:8749-9703
MKLLLVSFSCLLGLSTAAIDGKHVNTRQLSANEILLEDFSDPIHKWDTMNDPVMGGQSKSSLAIENGVARFTGDCAIVPFLKAPGFITMVTGGFYMGKESFPDINSCQALAFTLKTNVDYKGYRVSFGKEHLPEGHHAQGYKAPLTNLPSADFDDVIIPLNDFSSKWDDATGDVTVTCAENPKYCPSSKWLANMQTISFWGEGVEGEVDLEIKQIRAVGCSVAVENLAASVVGASTSEPAGGVASSLLLLCVVGLGFVALAVARQKQRQTANYEEIPSNEAPRLELA